MVAYQSLVVSGLIYSYHLECVLAFCTVPWKLSRCWTGKCCEMKPLTTVAGLDHFSCKASQPWDPILHTHLRHIQAYSPMQCGFVLFSNKLECKLVRVWYVNGVHTLNLPCTLQPTFVFLKVKRSSPLKFSWTFFSQRSLCLLISSVVSGPLFLSDLALRALCINRPIQAQTLSVRQRVDLAVKVSSMSV